MRGAITCLVSALARSRPQSLRRAAAAGVALVAAVAATVSSASAHALPVASSPLPGQILQQPPTSVVMTFDKAPDPALSYIEVYDASGTRHDVGQLVARADNPRVLTIGVEGLHRGVYTVAWRSVASDDGHRITGSFAFGVQVVPPAPVAAQQAAATSALTPLGVIARAALYVGLVALLGGAYVGGVAGSEVSDRLRRALGGGWVLAVVGVAGVTDSQLRSAGSGWGQLFSTSLGPPFVERLLPLLVAGAALAASARLGGSARRLAAAAVGLGAALSMLADSVATHASAEGNPVLSVGAQWIHIVAAGVWIGGLAALLLAISAVPAEARSSVIERFSIGAIISLLVITATGVVRSVAALGSWGRLFTTLYGTLVIAKVALILALAGLGALNRLNARRPASLVQGFRRIGAMQVVAGAAALVLAAALVNIAPPSAVAAASVAAPLVASGTDGGRVNAELDVSPGSTGFNHFSLRLTGYATGQPVENATVNLGFVFSGRISIGASTLTLIPQGGGVFAADGANLSLNGTWSITVAVRESAQVYDVPLQLTTHAPA